MDIATAKDKAKTYRKALDHEWAEYSPSKYELINFIDELILELGSKEVVSSKAVVL